MSGTLFLFINSIALASYAVFLSVGFDKFYLSVLLLFLPFLDKRWQFSFSSLLKFNLRVWLPCIAVIVVLVLDERFQPELLLATILYVALAEEWFFRAYYFTRLVIIFGSCLWANLFTSAFFTLLHLPVHGMQGLLVFVPSLFFGWIYYKYKDLSFVIIVHSVCNYIYLRFASDVAAALA